MRVLVLQKPTSGARFEAWLREAAAGVEVRIVTGRDTVRADEDIAAGVPRTIVDDYQSDATMRLILGMCADWRPDFVFSNAEADVLRAAAARSLFDIPGMKSSSAILFRDKALMKRLFDGLSIGPVPYRVPTSVEDVLDGCDELGPVVLKPRDGAGSVGVHVLATAAEAAQRLRAYPELLAALHQSRLLLEAFVEGDVYHVDILVRDGAPILVSPSRYLAPPHLFAEENTRSVMLDVDSPDYRVLVDYAEELTAKVAEHEPNIMHLEVYRTRDGQFLAGEVACRGGGGLIKETLIHTYGVDQAQACCLLNARLLPRQTFRKRIRPQSGWVLETGVGLALDPVSPPAWVLAVKGGKRRAAASSSTDAGLQLAVEGDSYAQVRQRIEDLHEIA